MLVWLGCILVHFSFSLSCILGFILFARLGLDWLFPFPCWGNFHYNHFKNSLISFLFLFFFWDPYNSNVGIFNIVPKVSETILSSLHSVYFILLFICISTILSFSSLIHYSASGILLLILSRVFLISIIMLFVSVCLFFL